MRVHVVGGGLAGSEASHYLAKRGHRVILHEMRPVKMTEVHKTGLLAELVCSNSMKSESLTNAEGLLKAEMRMIGSMILECADEARIPAGKALAVDREIFAECVTKKVEEAGVEIIREEVTQINPKGDEIWIIATGPATSEPLAKFLKELTGNEHFYFFDAVSPIVTADSIDMEKAFRGDRYGQGSGDYINCPLSEEEYERFWKALVRAQVIPMEDFDRKLLFERCMPIEEIARSGKDALRFGPLRPVGLIDPKTGKEPYAVVQLRQDNLDGTLYSLVGFQTRLRWGEQERVIRLIPCLENAEIVRYGVMHRNIYINSPAVLDVFMRLKKNPRTFFAGQITGVEGYVESAMSGLYVAFNVDRILRGLEPVRFPKETMMGALTHYITEGVRGDLRPMYANFGLLPRIKIKDKLKRRKALGERALKTLEEFLRSLLQQHPS